MDLEAAFVASLFKKLKGDDINIILYPMKIQLPIEAV